MRRMSAAFDTLKFTQRLEQAGINPEQATALAEAQREALDALLDGRLASKADIDVLRSEVKADIDLLRSEVKADIDILRSEVKADIDLLRSELKADIDALRSEFKTDIGVLQSEVKIDIGALKSELDVLRADVQGKFNLLSWMVGLSLIISLAMLPMMVAILLHLFG